MSGIAELITSKAIAAYWKIKKNERAPYFGENLFPNDKKLGLDLAWIKGARKAPVKLMLSAFDAKSIPLNRGNVSKLSTDMPFFKNSMDIGEKQRQELNKLIGSNANQKMVDIVVRDIFNDKMHLLENAALTREIMRMEILTTGALSLADNGQSYSYDYGVPSNHKVTPTVKWDQSTTADPVADINAWLDAIDDETGSRPTRGVMNGNTLKLIQNCDSIKNAIYVLGQGKVTPTRAEVVNYLQKETNVIFAINNKGYQNANGTSTKFIADGTVVLFPEGKLGNTWFGTTPEESDLMAGAAAAQVEIVDTGVAITTTIKTDPVNVETKVSMICLPSFEMAEEVIIATVKTA